MPRTEAQPENDTVTLAANSKQRKYTRSKPLPQVFSRPNSNPSNLMQRILPEELFLGMLCFERKRAERSAKKFFLLLLNAQKAIGTSHQANVFRGIVKAADGARRETDLAGWYQENAVLGIIFTELGELGEEVAIGALLEKVHRALSAEMSSRDLQFVEVSLHSFADDSEDGDSSTPGNSTFYPDLAHQSHKDKLPLLLKRVMDVLGSALAITIAAPVLIIIALLVKLTSKGPILFKQQRLGKFGKTFTFLKFRSMHVNNDLKIHQDFMKQLINGDHLAAYSFTDRENHARAPQPDKPRRSPPNPVRVLVVGVKLPRFFPPRRQIVNSQNGGRRPQIRHLEVRTVKDLRACLPDRLLDPPQPPSALCRAVWLPSTHQIDRRALRHRKRLVGKKRVDIFRKFPRQSDREFGNVARQSARGQS